MNEKLKIMKEQFKKEILRRNNTNSQHSRVEADEIERQMRELSISYGDRHQKVFKDERKKGGGLRGG